MGKRWRREVGACLWRKRNGTSRRCLGGRASTGTRRVRCVCKSGCVCVRGCGLSGLEMCRG
ncbi:hypothetical protein M431DRAFT_135493, partial [Trichoderma harzianum CBS 226.95]